MAVVKCKECGEQVSTKAKACPSCGTAPQKKTSLITWMALMFILLVVYLLANAPVTKKELTPAINAKAKSAVVLPSKPKELPVKAIPSKPAWRTSSSKDEMTGAFSAYAASPTSYPAQEMDFPYRDVSSWLAIGCDKNSEWIYFGFNNSPNLTDTETLEGYNLINTRIRWDDVVENVQLTQDWSSKFIHFRNRKESISKVERSNTAKLELHWYGQSSTYFEYTLNGSSKALAEIRSQCAKNK
ncbi:zinc ribbon domain-containing protein [Shewanella sp. HL-SH8]|uniref:zinc ribbon domain-containing protein n=1 Tax=Shewanella sp. HL-SH8 TaxID=3436242 RepID=UPI003EBF9DC2